MNKLIRYMLSLLLVLTAMWMIWSFSAMDADASSGESAGIVELLLRTVFGSILQLPQTEQDAAVHILTVVVRKTGHFAEFAILGMAILLHVRAISAMHAIPRQKLAAWGAATLYAASDEIHQAFVPGRAPRIIDVMLDSCGSVFGILAAVLLIEIYYHFRRRKPHTGGSSL